MSTAPVRLLLKVVGIAASEVRTASVATLPLVTDMFAGCRYPLGSADHGLATTTLQAQVGVRRVWVLTTTAKEQRLQRGAAEVVTAVSFGHEPSATRRHPWGCDLNLIM